MTVAGRERKAALKYSLSCQIGVMGAPSPLSAHSVWSNPNYKLRVTSILLAASLSRLQRLVALQEREVVVSRAGL